MKPINVSSLSAPISADSPAGPDLEYDPGFLALEEAIRTEPERQFGDTVVAAEEPDWVSVGDLALDLLSRSRDLRATAYLVQALVHENGLQGLSQGLALVRVLLATFWDSLHPQLDPDDNLDPTARVNIVVSLCDPTSVLPAVRRARIVQVPGLGSIALRDLQIAKGQVPPPDDAETLKLDSIEAAMRDVDFSTLEDIAACVESAAEDTAAIEQLVTDKVGVNYAVSLDPLTHCVQEIRAFLQEEIGSRVGVSQAGGDRAAGEMVSPRDVAGETKRMSGVITCSHDVTDALDKIIAYYRANEPSSPVPLLLERAKRLVSVGFMEILRDVAPDAVAQAEKVTGVRAEGNV